MIRVQQCREHIDKLSLAEIESDVVRCLRGHSALSFDDGYSGGQSEDFVTQLLRDADLQPAIKAYVLDGCRLIYHECFAWLCCYKTERSCRRHDTLIRLCNVVDIARPEELEPHANAFLSFILDFPYFDPETKGAIARAAFGYVKLNQVYKKYFWTRAESDRDIHSYGTKALAIIDGK